MRKEVRIMQMCPFCDKVYDESEYSHCPYCSGELDDDDDEVRPCPECADCIFDRTFFMIYNIFNKTVGR